MTKIMVHEKKEKEGDKIMVHEKKEKDDKMENAPGAISAGERHGDFEKREKAVGGGQPCEYLTVPYLSVIWVVGQACEYHTRMIMTIMMRLILDELHTLRL